MPFSQPRKDDGARVATAPGRVGWDNTTIKKGTIGAKERKKRNNNQKVYFLFLLRRGRPSQQGKMMARARRCGEGAFSVPQRAWDGTTQQSKLCCHLRRQGAWDGTTQQSKRNNRRQGKKKKKQQSKSVFSFPPEERAPFSARKDDGACATLWRGRLLSASARVGWDNTTIKIMLPWLIFHFHL